MGLFGKSDYQKFQENLDAGVKLLNEKNYIWAFACFNRALAFQEHPFCYALRAITLEKLNFIDEALREHNQNCFRTFNEFKYRNKSHFVELCFMADEFALALLRHWDKSSEHAPIKWLNNVLHREGIEGSEYFDKIRMTKAYLLLKMGNRNEAMELMKELSTSARDTAIRQSAKNWCETGTIIDGVAGLTSRLGVENLEEALRMTSRVRTDKN